MFKKILVAVDGYAPSLSAAEKAVELAAESEGAEVVALQVVEELPLLPAELDAEAASLEGADANLHIAEPLEAVAALGERHGVTVKTVKRSGLITATILAVADEVQADLIVVGESGLKGLKKLYFGSVARSVSEHARCPVLIMKKGMADISELVSISDEIEAAPKPAPPALTYKPETIRKNLTLTVMLLGAFAFVYFGAAVITSVEYKSVAAINVLGLPLAIWAGWAVLIGGLVITRIFLVKFDHGEDESHG